ncbi:MAG: TonB-dependent receptor [Gemmatimonadales bacterium]
MPLHPRPAGTTLRTLALVIGWAGALAAQADPGSVQGRLVSAEGRPVADGTVTLETGEPSQPRYTSSDRTGGFRFPALAPGRYRLRVQAIGYLPAARDSVFVEAGATTAVVIELAAAPRQLDPLVAEAAPVIVNRLEPGFDQGLRPEQLALLPAPNDSRSLIRVLPGVRPDQIWGAATAQANNYFLDGVPINHPGVGGDLLQPDFSWIERVEVRGLGTGAEYGDFQGGIVNVVTRSGTDRFEAGVRLAGEAAGLNGSNLRVSEIGAEPAGRREADGFARGPLRRGRLYYAVFGQVIARDYRVLNHVRRLTGDFSPVTPAERERKWLGKLDWRPGSRDALTAEAARLEFDVDRFGLDGFASPEATQTLRARTHYLSAHWQRTASPGSFIEARLGAVFGTDRRDPAAGSDVPGQRTVNEFDPQRYGNAEFREFRRPRNLTASVQWTLEGRAAGAGHLLKLGGEQQVGSWRFDHLRNGGLTWRPGERTTGQVYDPSVPATWPWNGVITSTWGGEVRLDAGLASTAAFVQDEITLGRVTLHAGLRLGRWSGTLAPSPNAARQATVSDAALDPRLGITVPLDRNGSVLARVHWGRYHQGIFAGLFDRAAGTSVYTNEERWDYSGPLFGNPGTTFTPGERDALAAQGLFEQVETITLNEVGRVEGYRQPYVEQWVGGIEAAIAGRWKAAAVYVRRRNRDMVALLDRNLATNYTVFSDVRVLDRFFNPVSWKGRDLVLPRLAIANNDIKRYVADELDPPPGLSGADVANLTYDPDLVLTNVPEARRRFDQLQLSLETRQASWFGSVSAALTRLDGNLNSVTGNDDASLSGAGPFVRLNEQYQFFGDLANQSDLELKLQLGGHLPGGFLAGAYASWLAGDVETPYLTLSPLLFEFDLPNRTELPANKRRLRGFYTSSIAGQRVFLESRGSFQYGSYGTLDLHLERALPLGGRVLLVSLDGFNVLGADTITGVQTSLTGDNAVGIASGYGTTRRRLPPRSLRLGVAARL